MKLQEYRLLSGDGEDELYGCAWLPDGPVKGYIQILHDLYDHIERYMHLLQFFAEHGYACLLYTSKERLNFQACDILFSCISPICEKLIESCASFCIY